ncbi:hypothetical protein MY04_5496 [Flammeovirga sp. MY04]|uniref:hypothetical protein n=1 Tax=Flammeovirga sp. MY04 TaxID=1191459 RepID=UPI000825944C|nr:hypothetical protein [Flammeovirga sp. MY04]ANQ52827.2 hypothetical protein MY04_5496 [Flammeovirga sp. MY04]
MKKQILMSVLAASLMTACTDTADLDQLTERVENIENRLDGNGSEQAASLEESLQAILDRIISLEGANASLDAVAADLEAMQVLIDALSKTAPENEAEIERILAELEALQNKVSGNSDMITAIEDMMKGEAEVWWGNIATSEDLTAFGEGNYAIISGDVYLNSDDVVEALQNVVFVGGNVHVGEVTAIDWDVENIGASLMVKDQMSITSLVMENLKSVGGELMISGNTSLETVELPSLAYVNEEVHVNGLHEGMDEFGGYFSRSVITTFDLSGLVVANDDMTLESIGQDAVVLTSLTQVNGDFVLNALKETATLAFPALDMVDGSLTISGNAKLSVLEMDELTYVANDLQVVNNSGGGGFGIGFGGESTGIEHLVTFGKLETVGGGIYISSNSEMKTIDAFNALTSVGEYSSITIENMNFLNHFNAFNALESANNVTIWGIYNYDDPSAEIDITAFNMATSVSTVILTDVGVKLNTFEFFKNVEQVTSSVELGGQWSPLRLMNTMVGFEKVAYLGWSGFTVYVETVDNPYGNWCAFADMITKKNEGLQMYGDIIFNERLEGVSDYTVVDNSTITPCVE